MALVVRSETPRAVLPAVREALAGLDPDLPMAAARTLDERLAQSNARYRFATVLLGVLAASALAMATSGVFAVLRTDPVAGELLQHRCLQRARSGYQRSSGWPARRFSSRARTKRRWSMPRRMCSMPRRV